MTFRILSIAILFFFMHISNAQKQGIEFGQNLNFIHSDDANDFTFFKASSFGISPSIQYLRFTDKNNFHEFGLVNLSISNRHTKTTVNDLVINGLKSSQFTTSLRYSFSYLLTGESQNSKFFIGLGGTATYLNAKNKPYISSDFDTSYDALAIDLSIIPRLYFPFTPTTSFTLNTSISLFNIVSNTQHEENPTLSVNQQRNSDTDFTFFPVKDNLNITLMAGLQVRF